MFSSQTVVELVKALAKALLVGGVAVWVIWRYHDDMLGLMHVAPSAALTRALTIVAICCALIVASLAVIVALDVPWQIWSHLKKLRMSKEDVRQEHKESEGDPHVKARIRQQQRQAARRRMMADVPKADVVVTNPTHYAVALRYDESKSGAARAGQGHRPDRGQDPRAGGRTQDSHIGSAAAGARIASTRRAGTGNPGRAVYRGGRSAGVGVPVALVARWLGTEPTAPSRLPVPAALDPQAKTAAQGV